MRKTTEKLLADLCLLWARLNEEGRKEMKHKLWPDNGARSVALAVSHIIRQDQEREECIGRYEWLSDEDAQRVVALRQTLARVYSPRLPDGRRLFRVVRYVTQAAMADEAGEPVRERNIQIFGDNGVFFDEMTVYGGKEGTVHGGE